ncbi:DNA-processing protein DprA [Mangrovihabitans endophyticus]|uniref:Putative DNA processing protein DprA n=1 Tax=Mangrovihabitans endophyticus TaxID=1751298 RepID=A0A8J3BZU2_9ACTN|nr:DNA-processing protein DprA [Mangrovihabitans endophyticus]GGK89866.1 putative DNA processing protein DprA [Mangrovihabitans endophyticus]
MTPAEDRTGAEDRVARVALTWLAEPGNRTVWTMVQSAGAVATLRQLSAGDFPESSLRAAVISRCADHDPRREAERALARAERVGARLVTPADAEWPAGVDVLATLELDSRRQIDRNTRPPLCLWVRGDPPVDHLLHRSVAIVGARAATGYGIHVTTDLSYGLAERDWTVVSGGAFGIDSAAHRGALAAGRPTVAVLACGVDRPYPAGNTSLFERVLDDGLLISEWPPGAEPLRHRFLIRNRVIAAATRGTIVVEAAARSGATQTMGRVTALNRIAMVVPGPVTSAMSVGCHQLLRESPQTRLITGLPEALDEIGRIGDHLAPRPRGPEHRRDLLDEDSAVLLEAIPARGAAGPEELAASAGMSLRTVLRRLSLLEAAGLVERRDGRFSLARPGRTAPGADR